MDPAIALRTLLDHVDHTTGACRPNELVGAVLPREVIKQCRDALATPTVAASLAARAADQ